MINHKDIPTEVQEAMEISQMNYVGSILMDKYLATVKKYPKWFPKQNIWHYQIPKETHSAYREEYDKLHSEIFDSIPNSDKGVVWYAQNMEAWSEREKEYQKRMPEFEKMEEELFKKYYTKYGVTYEEFGN